jgi:hypothetical protein
MDQSTLLVIMAGAVCVSAVALVFQAFLLFNTYRATETVRDRVVSMLPKVEALIDSSRAAVDEGRAGIAEVREKSNLLLDSGQKQMQSLQAILGDAQDRSRRQFEHMEFLVNDTLDRMEETVALVHKGVMKPVRGVTGLAAGLGAALQYLLRGRPRPDRVTVDEEMFI